MGGRKKGRFTWIFAITEPPLLAGAGRKRIRQILHTSYAIRTYAASDGDMREWLFPLFQKNANFFERQHVSAEHSDEEQDVGKNSTYKACFAHNRSFAYQSWKCARQRRHAWRTASCADAVEDGLLHRDRGASSDRGL